MVRANPFSVLAMTLLAFLAFAPSALAEGEFVLPDPQPMPDEPVKSHRPELIPQEEPVYVNPWHLGAPQEFFGFRTGYKLDLSRAFIGKEKLYTVNDAEAPDPWPAFSTYTVEGAQPGGHILRITGHGTVGSEADCTAVLTELGARIKQAHGPPAIAQPGKRLFWTWDYAHIDLTCTDTATHVRELKLVYTDQLSLDMHREMLKERKNLE